MLLRVKEKTELLLRFRIKVQLKEQADKDEKLH